MIRFATTQDVEQVNIIRKEVNDLHIKNRPDLFKPGFSTEIREYVKCYLNSDKKFLIVCEENNLICSYAMVDLIIKPETPYMFERKHLEINEIGTLKSENGKGYGKQIIQKVKELAKELGIHRIELNMWSFNIDALKFYEKNGFDTYRLYLEKFC